MLARRYGVKKEGCRDQDGYVIQLGCLRRYSQALYLPLLAPNRTAQAPAEFGVLEEYMGFTSEAFHMPTLFEILFDLSF